MKSSNGSDAGGRALWTVLPWSIGAVLAAWAAQIAIDYYTVGVTPLAVFYPAVVIVALKTGRAGGILTIALSIAASWFLLLEPRYTFAALDSDDVVRLLLFIANGVIMTQVCGRYRLSLDHARTLESDATRSAKLLEAIGAASPDLIYAKDKEFRTIYANPATLNVLGLPPSDVIGQPASDYATQRIEGQQHEDNDARVMERGSVEISDEVFTSPDGITRIFRSSKAPLRDVGGKIIGIAGVSVDVTEQRAMEAQLRHSEQQLRLALTAGRMAVWNLDHATDTLTASPEMNRLLGFPDDHALEINEIRARYYPGDRERLYERVAEALTRNERYAEGEFRYYHPDGSLRWFVISAELTLDAQGQLAKTTGVLLETTRLKTTEASLAEREAELKAALNAGKLSLVDYDHLTQTFRHSEGLNALYGYAADHQLTIEDVRARYHPDAAAAVYEKIARDRADVDVNDFQWVIRLLLPDGTDRWVEGLGEYVRNEQGEIIRSRGVVMDVTERMRSERHQRLLIAELNHRVKNTLSIVQGLAHQSFKAEKLPEGARRAFEGRLEALASAHNLLTKEKWEAADLRELIETALRPHVGVGQRVILEGPPIRLEPKLAVTFSMAIHELATNSLKYGSLSVEAGQLSVQWAVHGDGDARLDLRWEERGGPPVSPPARRGFGTRMIERALARDLEGKVDLRFDPDGVVCHIEAPYAALREKAPEGFNPEELLN